MAKKTTPPTNKAVSPKAAAPAATAPRTPETTTRTATPASKPAATAPKTPETATRTATPASKPAVTSPVEKAAPARKAATAAKTTKPDEAIAIKPEERWQMISEAAYYLAEKRGFTGGNPCQDWIEAEAQVDAMLKRRGAGRK